MLGNIPLSWAIGVIFFAGVAYALLQQTKKDTNGIGARQRRTERNMLLVLMVMAEKREDRELLARFLRE